MPYMRVPVHGRLSAPQKGRRLRSLLFCSLALSGATMALCAPARASDVGADAQLSAELHVARQFWAARGVTGCPQGISVYASHLMDGTDAAGWSEVGSCVAVVNAGFVGQLRSWSTRGALNSWAYRADECMLVTHEVGHALGLGHARSGVMAPSEPADLGAGQGSQIPWDCTTWAKEAHAARVRRSTR